MARELVDCQDDPGQAVDEDETNEDGFDLATLTDGNLDPLSAQESEALCALRCAGL